MLYNFLLEIEHDCAFSNFSKNHPEIEILLWCNSQHEILELKGEKKAIEDALPDLEEDLGTVIREFPEPDHVQLVFKSCECNKFPLEEIFNRYDCLELPPIKYNNGRELVNLLVTPDAAGKILEDIRTEDPDAKVKVLKLAPLKSADNPYPLFLPLDDLWKTFTPKQRDALKNAFTSGYYELPRKISLKELGDKMDIHKRTYVEHLRKAERKIMSHLIPALSL